MTIINRSSIEPLLPHRYDNRSQYRRNSTQALGEPVAKAICAIARHDAIRLTRTAASTRRTRTVAKAPTISSIITPHNLTCAVVPYPVRDDLCLGNWLGIGTS